MPVHSPRLKAVRRLGAIPGLTRKTPGARTSPPGGVKRARRAPSVYRRQLEEKQKVRLAYGVSERQMRRYLEAARAMPGEPGVNLFRILERRLDATLFRAGIAPTIPAARQAVVHGHVQVNGARVDRPSYLVSAGEVIALRDASVVVAEVPLARPAAVAVDESLVVAWYSR